MSEVTVYVPRAGSGLAQQLAPGSGVVGTPEPDLEGRVRIDYEGAIYQPVNIRTYADKVRHAADRHITGYATSARMWVDPEELIPIGLWDHETCLLTVSVPAGAYAHWVQLTAEDLQLSDPPRRGRP